MIEFRTELISGDTKKIAEVLESTGFFYSFEIKIATDIADITIEKGSKNSGYNFIIACENGRMTGFCCYGFNPCTQSSYDLYWIAVHQNYKNQGLGKQLIKLVEQSVLEMGGTIIWVETSGRALYEPTRAFYSAIGYEKVAVLPDYYAIGDDKIIYRKQLK